MIKHKRYSSFFLEWRNSYLSAYFILLIRSDIDLNFFNQFRITLNLISIIIFTKPLVNHDEYHCYSYGGLDQHATLCARSPSPSLDTLSMNLSNFQIWNFSFIVQPSWMIPSFCPIETWVMRNSPYLVNSRLSINNIIRTKSIIANNRNIQTSNFHIRHCKDK